MNIEKFVTDSVRRAARDAMQDAQKEAAQRERLKGRLGPLIGSFDDEGMTYGDMARYGLEKLNRDIPAKDADPAVVAMEHFLDGCGHAKGGIGDRGRGMDSADSPDWLRDYLKPDAA